jgi:hypothetical protein
MKTNLKIAHVHIHTCAPRRLHDAAAATPMQKRQQFKKKPPAGDETGANGDNGGGALRSAPQKVALSFDPDEEGPTVKIKKKKKRSQVLLPASQGAISAVPSPLSGTYSVDFLQKLRASQHTRTVDPEADDMGRSHGAGDADVAGVPSADAVRLAREARERARRIAAGDEDERGAGAAAGYIPLTDAEDGASDMLVAKMAEELRPSEADEAERSRGGGSGRLVREEQEEEEEGEEPGLDDMGGARPRGRAGRPRVTFGAAIGAAGAAGVVPSSVWRGTDARHASTVVEVEQEQEERREGSGRVAAESAADGSSDSLAALSAQLSARDFVSALDEKLAGKIGSLRLTLSQQRYEGEQAQERLQQCTADAAALEEGLQGELASFELLQRAQAFTEGLLDSLDDKAPQVEEIEVEVGEAMQALHARRLAMREAERAAECARAERVLAGGWVRPGLISLSGSGDALSPREAEALLARIEAARVRRRRVASARGDPAASDWRDGWSSAEEADADEADAEGDTGGGGASLSNGGGMPGLGHAGLGAVGGGRGSGTLARLRARVEAATQAAADVFDPPALELCDLQLVRGRFHQWQGTHRSSYEQVRATCPPHMPPSRRLAAHAFLPQPALAHARSLVGGPREYLRADRTPPCKRLTWALLPLHKRNAA